MDHQVLTLMGRATRDAATLTTKNGKEYAKFAIAVNEYRSDLKESTVNYYDVVGFLKQPVNAARGVKKGDVVLAIGKPEVNAYITVDGEAKTNVGLNASYLHSYRAPSVKPHDNMGPLPEFDNNSENVIITKSVAGKRYTKRQEVNSDLE